MPVAGDLNLANTAAAPDIAMGDPGLDVAEPEPALEADAPMAAQRKHIAVWAEDWGLFGCFCQHGRVETVCHALGLDIQCFDEFALECEYIYCTFVGGTVCVVLCSLTMPLFLLCLLQNCCGTRSRR